MKYKKFNIHYDNVFVETINSISKKSLKEYIKDRINSEIDGWNGLRFYRFSIDELITNTCRVHSNDINGKCFICKNQE